MKAIKDNRFSRWILNLSVVLTSVCYLNGYTCNGQHIPARKLVHFVPDSGKVAYGLIWDTVSVLDTVFLDFYTHIFDNDTLILNSAKMFFQPVIDKLKGDRKKILLISVLEECSTCAIKTVEKAKTRAESIRKYFVSQGIAVELIESVGRTTLGFQISGYNSKQYVAKSFIIIL